MNTRPDLTPSEKLELRNHVLAGIRRAGRVPFWRHRPLATAIGAVLLGGLAAGSVTSAAYASQNAIQTNQLLRIYAESAIAHSHLVGTSTVVTADTSTQLTLEARPDTANAIAVGFRCDAAGTITFSDKNWHESTTCVQGQLGAENLILPRSTGWGTMTVKPSSGAHVTVLASWLHADPIPREVSAQKKMMSDGVITRTEYVAAFNQYRGCMAAKGYPLNYAKTSSNVIRFGSRSIRGSAISDRFCYPSQFSNIDAEWQSEHEHERDVWAKNHQSIARKGVVWDDRRWHEDSP